MRAYGVFYFGNLFMVKMSEYVAKEFVSGSYDNEGYEVRPVEVTEVKRGWGGGWE